MHEEEVQTGRKIDAGKHSLSVAAVSARCRPNVSICRLLHRINQALARAISQPSRPIASLFFFVLLKALTNKQQEGR